MSAPIKLVALAMFWPSKTESSVDVSLSDAPIDRIWAIWLSMSLLSSGFSGSCCCSSVIISLRNEFKSRSLIASAAEGFELLVDLPDELDVLIVGEMVICFCASYATRRDDRFVAYFNFR